MVQTITHDLRTSGQGEMRDLSEVVASAVAASGLSDGIVTVCVIGSTPPSPRSSSNRARSPTSTACLEQIAPRAGAYAHHERWGDDNGSSHVRAAMIGPSLTLPFTNGQVRLGTWQQIVLAEFDTRPRDRQVVVQVVGE